MICLECLTQESVFPGELHPYTCEQWETVRFTVHTVCTTVYCTYSCFETSESCCNVNYCFSETDTIVITGLLLYIETWLILPPRGWDLPSFPFLLTLNSEMIQSVAAELLCFFCSVCRWRTDVGWSENRRKEWRNRGGLSIRDAKQSQKKCFRYISPSSSSYVCGFWWWHDFSVCVIFKVWFGLMGLFFSVVG